MKNLKFYEIDSPYYTAHDNRQLEITINAEDYAVISVDNNDFTKYFSITFSIDELIKIKDFLNFALTGVTNE